MPSFDVIRVEAHAENEALYFHGTTNPVFFKSSLTALVTDTDYVSVRNDVATGSSSNVEYEFYRIHFTKWRSSDNSSFASAQEAVDYINEAASVISGEGYIIPAGSEFDFELDDTQSTILISNGDDHAVNSIKAIEGADGRVHIVNHNNTATDYKVRWQDVTIAGVSAGTSLASVVNALNSLFTQTGGVGSGVVAPYSGVGLSTTAVPNPTTSGLDIVNPDGDGRWGVTDGATVGDATHYVAAPVGSEIDRDNEYYFFDVYNDAPMIIGLATDRAALDATPDPAGTKDSMFVWGVEFAAGSNSPTGTRGSASGRVDGPGWTSWGTSDARDTMVTSASGAASFRVGIFSGRYQLEYWDGSAWVIIAHSTATHDVANGVDAWLLVKFLSDEVSIGDISLIHNASADAAYRYIRHFVNSAEVYDYPLFATAAEAEAVDIGGESQAMIYANDAVPGTTWYAPLSPISFTQAAASAPSNGPDVVYTEIPSSGGSPPSSFGTQTLTVDEGAAVNFQVIPAGMAATATISGAPSGWVVNNGSIFGTAPQVTGDNVANPSDEYVITVTLTNSFGSSTGTLTVTVNNLTAPVTSTGSWTSHLGSFTGGVLAVGASADSGISLSEGERMIVPKEWVDAYIDPNTNYTSAWMGVVHSNQNLSYVQGSDFFGSIRWSTFSNGVSHHINLSGSATTLLQQTGASTYDFGFEVSGGNLYIIACNVNSLNTEPSVGNGGSFTYVLNAGSLSSNSLTEPVTVYLAIDPNANQSIDLSAQAGITDPSKITIPAASTTTTPFDKALDFSGGSEHSRQVSSSLTKNPIAMSALGEIVAAPANVANTSADADARPWATACVFQIDGNSSNQHIWNYGEGAGSTDDNIYVRVDSSRNLYFGWGRDGALNEVLIGSSLSTSAWYGLYVAHNGTRLSGANASAANLADCFQIRYVNLSSGSAGSSLSTAANWGTGSTGARMDRAVTGNLTVGGRGSNRNFHGKVASMVVTTLPRDTAMPDLTEIGLMVTNPFKWVEDYRIGSAFRQSGTGTTSGTFAINDTSSARATQIWTMGDGSADAYPNIQNYVDTSDAFDTRMQMQGMVSSDIVTVSIPGLS